MNTEIIHKEIDLIQNCINRMAQNSFLIKGWYISIMAVLIAWKDGGSLMFSILMVILTLTFMYLDTIYLYQEREFRRIYKERIELRLANDNSNLYQLNTKKINAKNFLKVLRSRTLWPFYLLTSVTLIFLKIVFNDNKDVTRYIVKVLIN